MSIVAPSPPRLSTAEVQRILQHPIDGPCSLCRVLPNGDGKHSGCWLCPAPEYGPILFRRLDASKHFLRTPPAIAFEAAVLVGRLELVVWVVVVDRETSTVFLATPEAFCDEGFEVERGHGFQLALPLRCWHEIRVESEHPTEQE